jgi:hypothetical protein
MLKHQAPTSKFQRRINQQHPKGAAIEAWNLELLWMLDVGAWILDLGSSASHRSA